MSGFVPLDRLRRWRARADEVRAIRRALVAPDTPAAAERAAAERVQELKVHLAAATGAVSACSRCARGKPPPRGRYAGGDCCSGRTALVFSADETAALALVGTRPRDLVTPAAEQAGCAFRGEAGCSLAVAHRPSICVRYACASLQRELHAVGRLDAVEALAVELGAALAEFSTARATRRAEQWTEALVDALR